MRTGILGGVKDLTADDLRAMQAGQYVLRAREGKLTEVAVEKSTLPHDPQGHGQAVSVAMAPDGAIYVNQRTIMCKSTDGGRAWASYERQADSGFIQILSNGMFITASGGEKEPISFLSSADEGRSWQKISSIELPEGYDTWGVYGLFRSPDDRLICSIVCSSFEVEGSNWISGTVELLAYRSEDKGRRWQRSGKICDWGSEGGIARVASGKLVAVIRHQRPLLPTDPPDLMESTAKEFK